VIILIVIGAPTQSIAEDTPTDESSPAKTTDSDSSSAHSDGPTDSKESGESSAESADSSGPDFVAAPSNYAWSVDIGYGSTTWRTAAASTTGRANLQAGALYRFTDIWSSSLRLDWSRRLNESGRLTTDTMHWRLLAGLGTTAWVNSVRLELQAQAGTLVRTVRHDSPDSGGVSAAAVRPVLGGTASFGVGFLESVVLSFTGGYAWSPPARHGPTLGIRLHLPLGARHTPN
jgi:hypothetical protein